MIARLTPLIALLLVGCIEKEIPVAPHEAGDVIISEAIMGDGYENQLYFSLESKEVVASNLMTDWDIAFRSAHSGPQMMLNSGRFMKLGVYSEGEDIQWHHENSQGAFYETALGMAVGEVVDSSGVLVVDLGYALDNSALGQVQMQIDSITNEGYYFRYGDEQSAFVARDMSREWNHYSLIDGAEFEVEPEVGDWDLYITRYTEYLNGETYYLVSGVLGVPEGSLAIDNADLGLEELMQADWDTLDLSSDWGAIGYDWKYYDFDTEEYLVDTERYFGVRTAEGKEFILRFIDFYDDLGNKGSIKLEVVER